MNAKKQRIFNVTAAIAFSLLSACRQETSRPISDAEEAGGSTQKINIEGVAVEVLLAERLDSYQTHYIMTYPPDGEQFIMIELRISGDADPEIWGRDHLTIGDDSVRFGPYHVRRVLIGEGYEYTANEDFKFHYQFFFSVPETFPAGDLSLYVKEQKALALAEVYVRSARQDDSPTSDPISGEFSVVAGGSGNAALATHSTVSGGQLNTAAVANATVGGGRENNASYLYTTINGGYGNLASGRESSIGGGSRNSATGITRPSPAASAIRRLPAIVSLRAVLTTMQVRSTPSSAVAPAIWSAGQPRSFLEVRGIKQMVNTPSSLAD